MAPLYNSPNARDKELHKSSNVPPAPIHGIGQNLAKLLLSLDYLPFAAARITQSHVGNGIRATVLWQY